MKTPFESLRSGVRRTVLCFCGVGLLLGCLVTGPHRADAALYATATNYAVGSAPAGAWLGNLRGKGTWRDLIVANSGADTVTIRLCLDNGTFGQANHYSVGPNPVAVRAGNFNGDVYEDIAVANSGTNTVSVLLNQGVGANFQTATNYVVGSSANPGPKAVTVGDVNQDGRVDIVVANSLDNSVSVLLGLGGGVFGPRTNFAVGTGPGSIYLADFTGDDIPDVLTANSGSDNLTILPGLGNGDFGAAQTIACPASSQPSYALPADFDGDGRLDIAVALQGSDAVRVFFYDEGDYVPVPDYPVGDSPRSLLLRDLNRDGYPDLVVANSGDDTLQVFLGSISGALTDAGTFAVGDNPGVVVGSNFNSDDAGDLAVPNTGDDSVSILLYGGPLAYDLTVTGFEDSPVAVPLNGRILDNSPLIYLTNSLPAFGTLSGPVTNLVYLPETNFFGTDSFQYSTTDGTLTSALATVTIKVTPVNDPPSFDLSTNFVSVMEDAATTNLPNFAVNLSRGPANESDQNLTFVLTATNPVFFASRPAISPTGTLTFRPRRNATGTQTVAVRLRDSGGFKYGGTNLSDVQYFTVLVTTNPVKAVRGTYSGLFYETNGVTHPTAGFFTFTVQASGAFSGRLFAEGIRYSMSGLFNLGGYAETQIVRNNTTLTVKLQLDLTNQSNQVLGTVGDQNWTADLIGDRALYHAVTNPAPQAGKYTLILPGNATNAAVSPGGDGYATVTVNSAGAVRVTGKAGDSVSFSQSTYLSQQDQWPLYASLYSTRGSLLGWTTITNLGTNSLSGDVSWIKTQVAGRYYPSGFTNLIALLGSTYVSPGAGRVIAVTNGVLTLRGGNLGAPAFYPAVLTETNTIYVGGAQYLKLASPTTGLMSGKFVHPTLFIQRPIYGVPLPQRNVIRGVFTGYDQTGAFEFGP